MINSQIHGTFIVSGFETYTGREQNTSRLLGEMMAEEWENVRYVEFPVVWGAPKRVLAEWEEEPWVWIALGERAREFKLETIAYNRRAAHPDKLGNLPPEMEIEPNGGTLVNPAPVAYLAEYLVAAGYPIELSNDAGSYLCEELFYGLLLRQAHCWGSRTLIHFLHVPIFGASCKASGETVDREYLKGFGNSLYLAAVEQRQSWVLQ